MAPKPPKGEGEIAEAVDAWLDGVKKLEGYKGYKMSYQMRVTALKMLMVGRAVDQFEVFEGQSEGDSEEDWRTLLGKVQAYATRRRLEALRIKNLDGMDFEQRQP